jgi:hypothetical protein
MEDEEFVLDASPRAERPSCSFCGKLRKEVRLLIAALRPKVHICNECVLLAYEVVRPKT